MESNSLIDLNLLRPPHWVDPRSIETSKVEYLRRVLLYCFLQLGTAECGYLFDSDHSERTLVDWG